MGAAARPTRAAAADGWLRRELGATLALSWPIILANVAINVMTATDFMMLGWLSPHALAAGALGFYLYQPPFLLGIGVVAALSPIAAAKIGAGQGPDALRRATHQALLSAVFIAARRLDRPAWADRQYPARDRRAARRSRGDAGVYLHGLPVGPRAEPVVFRRACRRSRRSSAPARRWSRAWSPSRFNALANYALIFGKLGMPALGIIGSGLATTLSQTLMFAVLIAAALIDPRMRPLRLFALPWRPAARELAALWRLGLPIGATIVAEVGVFAAATLVDGPHRPEPRSKRTRSRCRSPRSRSWSRSDSGQAATVRVGHAYGARDASRFRARGLVRVRPDGRSSPSSRRRR